ncbi:hypothetical protein BGZ58_010169 [Dissophora ornata]|nr:hypothetical protein BGZ58_010169 [Dissophora ornata]
MISILLSFSFLLSLILSVQAQITPLAVEAFAFARAGPKLYIQGGKQTVNNTVVTTTTQTYSLDLSTSWSGDAAPWTMLSPGIAASLINGVATPDNQTLIVFINGVNDTLIIPKYNIVSNVWDTNPIVLTPDQDTREGIRPVIDPTTWLTYLDAYQNMDIFNPNSSTVATSAIPFTTFTSRLFSAATYVSSRKTIMYFGGLTGALTFDPLATYVSEYNIATGIWSNFTTSGQPPEPRSDFCMTASEDGNTVLIYGGRTAPNTTQNPPTNFTGSFYMLDVPLGQWTQLPDGAVRLYMACLIIGDQFLAWGGSDGQSTHTGPPAIFSLTTRQWGTSYTAPAYYLDPSIATTTVPASGLPSHTGSSQTTDSSQAQTTASTNNLGAILGGVFGGLLRKQDNIQLGAPPEQDGTNIERLDVPLTSLDFNKSSDSQLSDSKLSDSKLSDSPSKNPHTPLSSVRGPQGFSGISHRSSMGSEMQYTVSHREPVQPGIPSSGFGTPETGSPVVYIPYSSYAPVPGVPVQSSLYANNGSYGVPVAMIAPNGQAYVVPAPVAYPPPPPPPTTSINNSNSNFGGSANSTAPTTPSLTTSNTVSGMATPDSSSPPSIPPRPPQRSSVHYTAFGPGSTGDVPTTAVGIR